MPALARDFEVIAVDQRGMGLSDKPQGGYDTGTQARELIGLIDALGHQRFAVIGHDIAPDVQSVVIPDTSHFLAEESPEELRLAIVVLAPLLAVAALVTLAAAILAIPYLLVRSIRSIRSHRAAPAPESAAADTARPRAVAASRPLG